MSQYGRITATAFAVPANKVTNDDLAKIMETSDEWIFSRTGIKERRIATCERTSDLCKQVAEQLMKKSGSAAEDIDFIIVATMTPDYATPATACLVQQHIQATKAFAFDLSAACSGFVYALSTAEKLIRSGIYTKGLVIGGETLSQIIDWEDRSTAVLFGDGAGGVVLEASEEPGILSENLATDGTRATSLCASEHANLNPWFTGKKLTAPQYLKMDGRTIYDFALRDVSKNILSLVKESSIEPLEIDYLLLHQANARIIDKLAIKTKLPREKFLTNMHAYGNTSAASIPILLGEAVEKGLIHLNQQQTVVLTGYGGGLTWGSLLIKL